MSSSPKLLVISLVASAALLLRDAVVVGELGLSVEIDGYVAAVNAFVLAGEALVSAAESSVVPELARLRSGGSRREVEFMVAVLAGLGRRRIVPFIGSVGPRTVARCAATAWVAHWPERCHRCAPMALSHGRSRHRVAWNLLVDTHELPAVPSRSADAVDRRQSRCGARVGSPEAAGAGAGVRHRAAR